MNQGFYQNMTHLGKVGLQEANIIWFCTIFNKNYEM